LRFLPVKDKIGTCASLYIHFINNDFHGFHWGKIYGKIKIGANALPVAIIIYGFGQKDGIRGTGISQTCHCGKIVPFPFIFIIDLGIDGEIGLTLLQRIFRAYLGRSILPDYRVYGTQF
jgi:hypothetical protein